jgi:hypothetical protein
MTMRTTRPPTLTLFQVCGNEHGGPSNPVRATMTPDKREALAEFRDMRTRYPEVYLAQAVLTRCPDRREHRMEGPLESRRSPSLAVWTLRHQESGS